MIHPLTPKQKHEVIYYLKERFGIELNILDGFEFYSGPKGRVFLGPKTTIGSLPALSVGLLIARTGGSIKPSTNLFQLFGNHVKKNFVSLTKEHAIQYIHGDDLELSEKEIGKTEEGYVLVRYLDFPLGCGLLKGNGIKNMLPKAKRLEVKFL